PPHLPRAGARAVVVSEHVIPEEENREDGEPRYDPVPEQEIEAAGREEDDDDAGPEQEHGLPVGGIAPALRAEELFEVRPLQRPEERTDTQEPGHIAPVV